MEELKLMQTDDESKQKMLDILKRVHAEEEMDGMDENDPESESDSLLSEETIQKILSGSQISLDDLTVNEQRHFRRAIASGELSKLIRPWEPWWLKPSAKHICLAQDGSRLVQQLGNKGELASLESDENICIAMSMGRSLRKLVSAVIFDLDGTLLNTDGVVGDILKLHLFKYGKEWNLKTAYRIVGKTPLEAAAAVVEDYDLPLSPDDFLSEIRPMFSEQWCYLKAQPGANRLISHLRGHGIPMALASNSPRKNVELKISCQRGWKESFSVIICGDEVENGKPSPKIYLEAAKRLSVDPSSCLVIEDSLPGVTAGKAAGMEVVAVPSVPKQSHNFTLADEVINSLLDLQLEKWGLPPFQNWIEGTLPIEPWHIGGPVIKGFGRGSKVLGIPTANLSIEGYSDLLAEHPSGVYFGWAGLSTRGVFKMVMSIGWNPYFNNAEKTIEPWLLHEFNEDFYGKELRLVIVGYIRPEANFPSLESLAAKIYEDRDIAERALELPQYSKYKNDPYLQALRDN